MKLRLDRLLLSRTPEAALPSAGLLAGRLAFGLTLVLTHGRGTLEGFLRDSSSYPDPIGLGPQTSMALMLFAELFCALLVALGLLTRLAAIPLVIGFSVAVLIQHAGDPFSKRELAFLYLAAFATFLLTGPGRYSIDRWMMRRSEERSHRAGVSVPAAVAVLLLASPAGAATLDEEGSTTRELSRGVHLLLEAREKLGPLTEIAVTGTGTIDPAAQLQGYRPGGSDPVPFREEMAVTADGRIGYESRYTRRDGTEEWLRYAYRGDEMQFSHVTEGFATRVRNAGFEDAASRLARMLPHILVDEALENPAAIRLLPAAGNGESATDRVAFALRDGQLLTLELDRRRLVTGFEYAVDFPLLGDTVVRWDYGRYRRVAGALLPSGYRIRLGGRLFKNVDWSAGPAKPSASTAFTLPPGVEPPPEPRPPSAPSEPPAPRVVERAPGVWQVQRLRSGFHPMFVEMEDFVIAIEAPTGWLELHEVPATNFVRGASSSSVSETFIRLINETVPEKPIRYLVLTHFHNDHSGGLRPFVAAGAKIVTTPGARDVLEEATRRPHRIAGDALQRSPREAAFEIVDRAHTLSDGTRRVELLSVENEHAEEMLVVWMPEEKLLFVSDLFLPLSNFPSKAELPMNLAFVEWLDGSGLEPEILLSIHGASRGTTEQLQILREIAGVP